MSDQPCTRPTILVATSNPHKLEEIRAVLEPIGFEVIGLDSLPAPVDEPVEDGDTFAANARLKAVYYARHANRPCLADDSGLEVDALDGAPGVISARYAQMEMGDSRFESASRKQRDAANNAKLVTALSHVSDAAQRSARFVCHMCLAAPDGSILAQARGTFDGTIAFEPHGDRGFGYDPLVYIAETSCTVAQLTADQKNSRSHRGQATRRMADHLQRLVGRLTTN